MVAVTSETHISEKNSEIAFACGQTPVNKPVCSIFITKAVQPVMTIDTLKINF